MPPHSYLNMPYQYPKLQKGVLIKRYKRFFADIQTEEGLITAHNPNTGSMRSLLGNYPVLYSESDNPKRKLKYTLEFISVKGEWIATNTIRTNRIIENALLEGKLSNIYKTGSLRREYPYKDSKIDFIAERSGVKTLIEVKSVTFFDDECCYFPDAVTERGLKHLHTLQNAVKDGYRAVLLFACMVKRASFACAANVDRKYCEALAEAAEKGVEIFFAGCTYNEQTNSINVEEIYRGK